MNIVYVPLLVYYYYELYYKLSCRQANNVIKAYRDGITDAM